MRLERFSGFSDFWLEPVADFGELLDFDEAYPTPQGFRPESPAWRLESVAARVMEGLAIAVHEPLTEAGYRELARILRAYTEYLYVYPEGEARARLEAAAAVALVGSVCPEEPDSEFWRLAGFGRLAAGIPGVVPHLAEPIDLAFSFANRYDLPILDAAAAAYTEHCNPSFVARRTFRLPLRDADFLRRLDLDVPGMEAVKAAVSAKDIPAARAAYTAYRQQFIGDRQVPPNVLLGRSDSYGTAKSYIECLLRLLVQPTPAIAATTEIGIAAHLFPEFRGSEHLVRLAARRYAWIGESFFAADGFHKDRTLRAQVEAISDFSRYLGLCADPEGEPLHGLVRQLVESCIRLSRPDGGFPPLGSVPAPNFGVDDLRGLVGGADFPSVELASHAFPETDCYVMRGEGGSAGQYLFVDGHPDSRCFLYAQGVALTTGAVRVRGASLPVSAAFETVWVAEGAFDFLEKWWHGEGVDHKRSIFSVKGEYFVLHDLVLGSDARCLEQVFGLGGAVVDIDGGSGTVEAGVPGQGGLFIGVSDPMGAVVEREGDSVVYRCEGRMPLVVNTVLCPMVGGAVPRLDALAVQSDPDVVASGFRCRLGSCVDTFLISDDGLAVVSAGDIRFIGEFLFLRWEGVGYRYVVLNGRFLEVGGCVLLDVEVPRGRCVCF